MGSEIANPNNMMQIIIGRINSIFRFTFNCEYLANVNAAAPIDKMIEPLRTAPLIPITNPIATIINEALLI